MALAAVGLVASLAIILAACEFFTNGVEWLGRKLNLNEGVVGSILAAVGTAMPETLIPLVAILLVGTEAAHEVGIGAILGAPFMLSTAAFFVTGTAITIFSAQGKRTTTLNVNRRILGRDMTYFLIFYLIAISSTFIPVHAIKVALGLIMVGMYGLYVLQTFRDEGAELGEEELGPLYFDRWMGSARTRAAGVGHSSNQGSVETEQEVLSPHLAMVIAQVLVALAGIIAGARLFVANIDTIALGLGVPVLVLSLIIAPLATELPEKFNSVLWVRRRKDTLALGNISGAMVFQSCIPVAVGMTLTAWELTPPALASAAIAIVSTLVVMSVMRIRGVLTARILMLGGIFYLAYIAYVISL